MRLAIDQIIVSKDNPRQNFDEEGLRRLGESIKSHGQLQPILVRPRGQNYELLVGERRLRASALVGLSSIDAEVRDVDDVTALEFRLIENTQREDLSDAEKGDAVLSLWANYDKYETLKDVAKAISFSERTVEFWVYQANNLSLKVREYCARSTLTSYQVRYLPKYSHSVQDKLVEVIKNRNLSGRQSLTFTKLYDANPDTDLDQLADKALGIETVTVPKSKIPKEVLDRINEEKEQLAKVRKIRTPRKKPSKPITKEQVKQKMANSGFGSKNDLVGENGSRLKKSAFKFERVRVTGGKREEPTAKAVILPIVVPLEKTPDYSLCKCANCPLYGKHCRGRCWND